MARTATQLKDGQRALDSKGLHLPTEVVAGLCSKADESYGKAEVLGLPCACVAGMCPAVAPGPGAPTPRDLTLHPGCISFTQVYLVEEQIDVIAVAERGTIAEVISRALDAFLGDHQDVHAVLTAASPPSRAGDAALGRPGPALRGGLAKFKRAGTEGRSPGRGGQLGRLLPGRHGSHIS